MREEFSKCDRDFLLKSQKKRLFWPSKRKKPPVRRGLTAFFRKIRFMGGSEFCVSVLKRAYLRGKVHDCAGANKNRLTSLVSCRAEEIWGGSRSDGLSRERDTGQ